MSNVRYQTKEENGAREISTTVAYDKTELSKLVEWAVDGNVEAFGELYSIYLDQIYRYVFYQVKDRMTAEDLTEEIFVKAWKALGRYKQKKSAFSAWLYRVARNHVIDYFRTRRQHQALAEEIPTAAASLEQEVEARLMQQELSEAISYLPFQQRQIIILKFIEGLENSEIAQIMGKREGAIRVMQMRALMALRQKLSSESGICKLSYLKPLMKV